MKSGAATNATLWTVASAQVRAKVDFAMATFQLALAFYHYLRWLDLSVCDKALYQLPPTLTAYPCNSALLSRTTFVIARMPWALVNCISSSLHDFWALLMIVVITGHIVTLCCTRADKGILLWYDRFGRRMFQSSAGLVPKAFSLLCLLQRPNKAPSPYFTIYLPYEACITTWQLFSYSLPFWVCTAILAAHCLMVLVAVALVPATKVELFQQFQPVATFSQAVAGVAAILLLTWFQAERGHGVRTKQPTTTSSVLLSAWQHVKLAVMDWHRTMACMAGQSELGDGSQVVGTRSSQIAAGAVLQNEASFVRVNTDQEGIAAALCQKASTCSNYQSAVCNTASAALATSFASAADRTTQYKVSRLSTWAKVPQLPWSTSRTLRPGTAGISCKASRHDAALGQSKHLQFDLLQRPVPAGKHAHPEPALESANQNHSSLTPVSPVEPSTGMLPGDLHRDSCPVHKHTLQPIASATQPLLSTALAAGAVSVTNPPQLSPTSLEFGPATSTAKAAVKPASPLWPSTQPISSHSLKVPQGLSRVTINEDQVFDSQLLEQLQGYTPSPIRPFRRSLKYTSQARMDRVYVKIPFIHMEDLPTNFLERLNLALTTGVDWMAVNACARSGCVELVVDIACLQSGSQGAESGFLDLHAFLDSDMGQILDSLHLKPPPGSEVVTQACGNCLLSTGSEHKVWYQQANTCWKALMLAHANQLSVGLAWSIQHIALASRVWVSTWHADSGSWQPRRLNISPDEIPKIQSMVPLCVLMPNNGSSQDATSPATDAHEGTSASQASAPKMSADLAVSLTSTSDEPQAAQASACHTAAHSTAAPGVQIYVQVANGALASDFSIRCCGRYLPVEVVERSQDQITLQLSALPPSGLLMLECKMGSFLSDSKPLLVTDSADISAEVAQLVQAGEDLHDIAELLVDLGCWLDFAGAIRSNPTPGHESVGHSSHETDSHCMTSDGQPSTAAAPGNETWPAQVAPGSGNLQPDLHRLYQSPTFRSFMSVKMAALLAFAVQHGWVCVASALLRDLKALGHDWDWILKSTQACPGAPDMSLLQRALSSGNAAMMSLVASWIRAAGAHWQHMMSSAGVRVANDDSAGQQAASTPEPLDRHDGALLAERIQAEYERACLVLAALSRDAARAAPKQYPAGDSIVAHPAGVQEPQQQHLLQEHPKESRVLLSKPATLARDQHMIAALQSSMMTHKQVAGFAAGSSTALQHRHKGQGAHSDLARVPSDDVTCDDSSCRTSTDGSSTAWFPPSLFNWNYGPQGQQYLHFVGKWYAKVCFVWELLFLLWAAAGARRMLHDGHMAGMMALCPLVLMHGTALFLLLFSINGYVRAREVLAVLTCLGRTIFKALPWLGASYPRVIPVYRSTGLDIICEGVMPSVAEHMRPAYAFPLRLLEGIITGLLYVNLQMIGTPATAILWGVGWNLGCACIPLVVEARHRRAWLIAQTQFARKKRT